MKTIQINITDDTLEWEEVKNFITHLTKFKGQKYKIHFTWDLNVKSKPLSHDCKALEELNEVVA